MVLPGHLAGGYLATIAILNVFHPALSTSDINTLLVIGTIAGDLPDIDLFLFNIKYRNILKDRKKSISATDSFTESNSSLTDSHRNYITHIPFFWLFISIVISLFGYLFDSVFISYIGIIILSGTWSHFILDSIEYGIRWLAPLSNRRFAFKLNVPEKPTHDRPGSIKQYFHFLIQTYWKMSTFWIEIIVTITAVCILAQHL